MINWILYFTLLIPLGPSATPAPEGKSTAKSVRKYGANSR